MEILNHGHTHYRKNKISIEPSALGVTVIALLAGIINGLIGAGGGIVLSLGLTALLGKLLSEKKDIYFNSQAAMIPVSIISYFLYAKSGSVSAIPFRDMLFPALAGGIIGGIASNFIDSKYIRLIFALAVIFAGARMIISAM